MSNHIKKFTQEQKDAAKLGAEGGLGLVAGTIGRIGKAFGNAVAGILRTAGDTANGEYLAAVKTAGNKFKEQWEKLPATAGAIAIQQAAKAITGDAIGIQDVFSSIGGGILNPNVELIFGGHDLRTLTLSFLMVPYNRREAEIIEKAGIPGNIAKATRRKDTMPRDFGLRPNCPKTALSIGPETPPLVTSMPAAVDTIRAGI